MAQTIVNIKNSTMSFVHSFQRLDSQLPVPYQQTDGIAEVVYDTDKPEDYGEVPVNIDWDYNEDDMINIINSVDNTLIINEIMADPVFTPLDPIIEEGLNKSSAMVMGIGDTLGIETIGVDINDINSTNYIQASFLPDKDYPTLKEGRKIAIPEPTFSYDITVSGTSLVPDDMANSTTWINIFLSMRNDEMIQSDILYDDNSTETNTVDTIGERLDLIDQITADSEVPSGGGGGRSGVTVLLPPNIVIQ